MAETLVAHGEIIEARLCEALVANYLPSRGYGRGGFGALYAITPDWHPIIDRLPGLDGAYCAVGFSGQGFPVVNGSPFSTSSGRPQYDMVVAKLTPSGSLAYSTNIGGSSDDSGNRIERLRFFGAVR